MRLYALQLVSKVLTLLHHGNLVSDSRNANRHGLKTVLLQFLMTLWFRQIRGQSFAQRGPRLAGHIQRDPSLLFGRHGILHRRVHPRQRSDHQGRCTRSAHCLKALFGRLNGKRPTALQVGNIRLG